MGQGPAFSQAARVAADILPGASRRGARASGQAGREGTIARDVADVAALDLRPRAAMQILRHSKISITMEIYTEAPSEATVDALRKLSEQLAA
jgi:hypothetical protein